MKLTAKPPFLAAICGTLAILIGGQSPVLAQKIAIPAPVSPLSYADTADLSLASRIAAQIRIRKADLIRPDQSPGLIVGRRRYLIDADVISLIRGNGGLVPRITFLADLIPDARGKIPKLAKAQMLVFAVPSPGRTG
ncbi:MAG: hypothetical protein RL367_1533, partial [Pseudomonadota bacterium]